MGSNVIFRFSFRSSLFIVYQYYTGCWFYFSYFLLYLSALFEEILCTVSDYNPVEYLLF